MRNYIEVKTVQSAQSAAVKASFALTDRVAGVLFDDLTCTAAAVGLDGDTKHTWASQVIDVHLAAPTRRPFTVTASGSINAIGAANASARISVGGQTTVREVRSRTEMREMTTGLKLHVKRSSQPRDRLRVLLWVEANSEAAGAQASAAIDSCDIQAK